MLKAHVDNETWLVQQPHHAQVSGFLAAHWGGTDGFARPGHYPGATHPGRWRDEVVLGIAEHDNGWWETEAMPQISEHDGLPVGVGEAAPPTPQNEFTPWISRGFDRWRSGIHRLAHTHPYAALLTSLHAYWLYAVVFDDLAPADVERRRHFVFGSPEVAEGLVTDRVTARSFLIEQADLQETLKRRLSRTPDLAGLIRNEHLEPHLRLLQLLDSMSLLLALNDTAPHRLPHVPRSSWTDTTELAWTRIGPRTIELDPYPFDTDGLVVAMPTRVIPDPDSTDPDTTDADSPDADSPDATAPISRLHASSLRSIEFEFVRQRP